MRPTVITIFVLSCIALFLGGLGERWRTAEIEEAEELVFYDSSLGSVQMAEWFQRHENTSLSSYLSRNTEKTKQSGIVLLSQLGAVRAYENLMSPFMITVVVAPGLRREQVGEIFAHRLEWNELQKNRFSRTEAMCYRVPVEGRYYPAVYSLKRSATPEEVEYSMNEQFRENLETILVKEALDESEIISSALTIASLIEREAAGAKDARVISGVIWNRMIEGMSLDIDATLQYVKGSEGNWWPRVHPDDKFIDSPYNTYQNIGLPPGAIANPSLRSIEAAFNPEPTDCFFYLHDEDGEFYCAETYEEHKQNIEQYLR